MERRAVGRSLRIDARMVNPYHLPDSIDGAIYCSLCFAGDRESVRAHQV